MTKVIYPDEGEVELEYDRLGRKVSRTDQRGTERVFEYIDDPGPGAGRLEADVVEQVGADTEDTVRRVERGDDDHQRTVRVTLNRGSGPDLAAIRPLRWGMPLPSTVACCPHHPGFSAKR